MAASLTFAGVLPAQHVSAGLKIITDTTEDTFIHFDIESDGFKTRTWWPKRLPGNPAWLPFVNPVWYSWSYTDQKGYPRSIFDMPALANRSAYQRKMPAVAADKDVDSFRIRVDAKDDFGNRASATSSLKVHRAVEVERRPGRDRNAPGAIVERVSGVYPGPAKVTYSEQHSRSFQRSYSETQSGSVNLSLAALNVGFGLDVTKTISSADESAISKNTESTIDKGMVGIWYRKVQPYERHGDVFAVDEWGTRTPVNQVVVIDYLFSSYLGQGVDEAAADADARMRLA
jgi:hypothetical protein